MTDWLHQSSAVSRIISAFDSGSRAVCFQLATGGGKSRIIRRVTEHFHNQRKHISLVTHRKNLVRQLAGELKEAGLNFSLVAAGYPMINTRIKVCSLQTMVNRFDRMQDQELIVVDECFPPGTVIDGYGAIDKAKINDIINSYDEISKKIVKSKISKLYKHEYCDDLVEITVKNKKLISTINHPVLTVDGWKAAKEITNNDIIMFCMQERIQNKIKKKNMLKRMSKKNIVYHNGTNKQKICFRKNEKKQFNMETRGTRKAFKNIKTNWTQAQNPRRKRKTFSSSCKSIAFSTGRNGIFNRSSNTDKNEPAIGISNMLQNRYCKYGIKTWNRSRWRISYGYSPKVSGYKKRKSLEGIRVDNIKIYERGSRIWNEKMHDQNFVYNIHVENTETYFVNNFVVHNCHHIRSKSYMKLFEAYPDAKILGVTATPQRTDGKPLRAVFDTLIQGPSMRELIDQKILCPYDYYAPETLDMRGVHISMGEFSTAESQARVDKKAIIGSVIGHYRELADHKPAIVSCVSIEHAEHVAAQFREAGYRAQAVHSKIPDELIQRYINGLRDGSLELLMQCELLGEGVDIRGAEVLIQLRPTMSVVIFLQHIGRVLRGMPGKRAIILDHVSNYERHGMPDDPREWTLDGYDKVDKGILKYKRCPKCNRGNIPKASRSCQYCGYTWQACECELPEEKDGKLVKVSGVELIDFELVSHSFEEHKKITIAQIAQAKTFEDAKNIARARGYENQRFTFYVWTKILKRRILRRVV